MEQGHYHYAAKKFTEAGSTTQVQYDQLTYMYSNFTL